MAPSRLNAKVIRRRAGQARDGAEELAGRGDQQHEDVPARRRAPGRRSRRRRRRPRVTAVGGPARRRGTRAAGSSRRSPSRRSTARCPSRPPSAAPWVSSDRWAEASKPVIVYCVSRKPQRQHASRTSSCSCSAEAGVVDALGEHEADALVRGRARRSGPGSRSRAPATCHHTEMLLMIASRWLRKMFSTAASTRMTTKIDEHPRERVVVRPAVADSADGEVDERRAPYATDAVTATRPIRFSQPVKKPAAGPPSLDAHQ